MKRKPNIPKFKEKLFIVCEGIGDKIYLDKVFSLYKSKYEIKVIPSGGKDKIIDKVRDVLILHPHNECFIFVDTDIESKKTIDSYKRKMKQEEISYEGRVYFVNPIIEYLYLITQVDKHPSNYYTKGKYAKLFEKYFGIIEYSGTQKEYEEMAKKINIDTFEKNLDKISTDVLQTPSSTIKKLKEKIVTKDNK